jgi:Lactonase, 7-bladed beta-propeller
MSKKIGGVVALAGMCALSLFLLNCGSSSSRPSGVLYVLTQGINAFGNNVTSFAMDLNSGNLSLINSNASTCPTPASNTNPEPCGAPLYILLDPTGATAFVLNQGIPSASVAPTIYSYGVNSDGSLGAATLAATLRDGDIPVAMVRDTTGQFLFVIDQGSFPPPGYPTPSPTNPSCPHVPTSATDVCPSISVFAMKSSSLTLASGSPFYLSKIPSALSAITYTPPGSTAPQELLFVTNNEDICSQNCIPPSPHNDNTVSVYTVSLSSGALAEQTFSPYAVAAINPISVLAVNTNPAGETAGGVFVYVGNNDQNGGHLYPFQVCTVINAVCNQGDVNIALMTPLGETCPQPPCNNVPPTTVGQNPVQMLVDPTNNFLYVASEGSSQVYGFQINTIPGTLTPLNTPNLPTGSQPVSMALHPSVDNTGQFLYTSNTAQDNITGFALSTTSGSMSSLPPVITPATPSGMAAH